MSWFKSIGIALRSLFGRRAESELDEELRIHLEMEIEHNVSQGMPRREAERAARVALGGLEQTKEASRDAWGWRILPDFWRDSLYALKSLRRTPGFTAIAVLTLGLGIGVNAVMFSFVRDTVLRPLLRDQSLNLVSLYNSRAGADRDFRHFTYAEFEALRASTDAFADVAATIYSTAAVGVPDHQQRRFVGFASENFFDLVGTQPLQGRFFNAAEAAPDAAIPVAVANHAFWARLGYPANFVGSTIRVNQHDYTVIGITPPGFVGLHVSVGPEVWLPLGEHHRYTGESLRVRTHHPLGVIARFAPEISLANAAARLPILDARLNALAIDDGPRQLVASPPPRTDLGSSRPPNDSFLNLFAVLSLSLSTAVLVIACLNLANMVLARGAARRKEIAIRLSLGASRGRIVRQLTTEGLMLALLGGAFGLFLSVWADSGIQEIATKAFATSSLTQSITPFFDPLLVAATFGFCLVATLASSLGPALRLTRPDLTHDLKQGGVRTGRGAGWMRFFSLGNNLVVLQIGLSLTLLFSASLFVRSSLEARKMELGFKKENQLVANLDYGMANVPEAAVGSRQRAMLDHLAPLVGEGQVALASVVPYNFELGYPPVFPVRDAAPITLDRQTDGRAPAGYTAVSENYFSLLGIPVLHGRAFTRAEAMQADGPGVAIIDEGLARTLFGQTSALGQRVYLGEDAAASGDPAQALEIVGVVRSPRDDVFSDAEPPRIYRPLGQAPASNIYLHLGTATTLERIDTIRATLRDFDPGTPVLTIRSLASFVDDNVNGLLIELAAMIFGFFGAVALLLAVVGVYGVKSHAVARRTREIGIRMALGARPGEVMSLILRQGAMQTAVGLLLGGVVAVVAGQLLASMIYQAKPSDPLALIGSGLILAAAVMTACYLPARRATRVDPATTLRSE